MPLGNEAIYEQITLRMALVLSLVARGHSYAEIASALNLGPRTVAGDASRAEILTGSANQGEMIRWWQDYGKDWAGWWLARLGIDPAYLIA
jgi:DNA-binding CsgD family transcriptional regulator